jgi:hypothetical protein
MTAPGRRAAAADRVGDLHSHANPGGDLVLGGFGRPEEDRAARIAPLAVPIAAQAAHRVFRAAEVPVRALAAAAVKATAEDKEHEAGRGDEVRRRVLLVRVVPLGELARHVNQSGKGGHRRYAAPWLVLPRQ